MNLLSDPSPAAQSQTWRLHLHGDLVFDWAYGAQTSSVQNLYAKSKHAQWDASERINWQQDLEPDNPFGYDDRLMPLSGTKAWASASANERANARHHYQAYMVNQFLHGEQAALMAAARLVQILPDVMGKQMAAQQVADEARHVEVFERLICEKIQIRYPADTGLKALIEEGLCDHRWDFVVLTTQVLIEGMALVSLQQLRDFSKHPLISAIGNYVMTDEARHVAYGQHLLKDHLSQLSTYEKKERHDFLLEGTEKLKNGILIPEIKEFHLVSSDRQITEAFMKKMSSKFNARISYIFNDLIVN
jgi:hypothetical protein